MDIKWAKKAQSDLARLHDFLAVVNPQAADRVARSLATAPIRLEANPRIGRRLEQFAPREVCRILIDHYEPRYEITGSTLTVLRVWHTREDR